MKIAIVAPSPVPFTMGGAENLFLGLLNYINEKTEHQCELIKIVTQESNLKELIDSYEKFSKLNLDHFDCVISTKYPSWMIRHRNHVCYMLHKLRGLYDTYHFTGLSEVVDWTAHDMKEALKLRSRLYEIGGRDLDAVFDACRDFINSNPPASAMIFPGPFSRWLIHYLDSLGLDTTKVTRYLAISEVVKKRIDYFPSESNVTVIYPPSRMDNFYFNKDDYIFTVSRLDGPKRIRLLIDAMRYVKSNVNLLIAGTGPDEEQIKMLALGDKRIKLLGFVKDSDVLNYYANSLVVPFIPYDEDYGLVTIEAMMSSKPVITLLDSGGPNEFVINGVTGFSVKADAKSIAEKIDYFYNNKTEAKRMGENARKLVEKINWKNIVSEITINKKINHFSYRKKVIVATTFPIYPPRGGGQSRVFHLYKNLARYYDITIMSLCAYGHQPSVQEIAPNLIEVRTPISKLHQDKESEISSKLKGIPVTDAVMSDLIKLTPKYAEIWREYSKDANITIACHPYLFEYLSNLEPNMDFWLECQDVEIDVKKSIYPKSAASEELLEKIKNVESLAWHKSKLAFTCTGKDLNSLEAIYGKRNGLTLIAPNGFDEEQVNFVGTAERARRKKKLGRDKGLIALFMGSWHGPNIEAIDSIITIANDLPEVSFWIIGSVCDAISNKVMPQNVYLLGLISDSVKEVILGTADIALNPMKTGSGSNLKVLDYFGAGIPLISTKFGMRGIDAKPNQHYVECELNEFSQKINTISMDVISEYAINARKLAVEKYSWTVIADELYNAIKINTD